METQVEQFRRALADHGPSFGLDLQQKHFDLLVEYYELVMKWNPRLHLVAPCPPEEFAVRHILESLFLLKFLPVKARVADIGSGAGLPLVPCLLIRDDLRGVLIESSTRKAVFLREALRAVESRRWELITTRFEDSDPPDVEFVTSRALDKFSQVLPQLVGWVRPQTKLLLFAGEAMLAQIERLLATETSERIPLSDKRFLVLGRPHRAP